MPTIKALSAVTPDDIQRIAAPLDDLNATLGLVWNPSPIAFALLDAGAIVGGLVAEIEWEWLYIKILAVRADLRGCGHGRDLMARAEAVAAERGCRGLWVSTYSFQAPGFYRRMGFDEFGSLENSPRGHLRLFFQKPLAPPSEPQ